MFGTPSPWPVPPSLAGADDSSAVILSRLPSPEVAPVLGISPRMGPAARVALLGALADEGAALPVVQAWARSLLGPPGTVARVTPESLARGVLRAVRSRVRYQPDPAGTADYYARVPAILARGADDCEGLSTVLVALARASGLAASVTWLDQPGAAQHHVSARVYLPGAGWTWAETSIPAALGEHPYAALLRLREGGGRVFGTSGGVADVFARLARGGIPPGGTVGPTAPTTGVVLLRVPPRDPETFEAYTLEGYTLTDSDGSGGRPFVREDLSGRREAIPPHLLLPRVEVPPGDYLLRGPGGRVGRVRVEAGRATEVDPATLTPDAGRATEVDPATLTPDASPSGVSAVAAVAATAVTLAALAWAWRSS